MTITDMVIDSTASEESLSMLFRTHQVLLLRKWKRFLETRTLQVQ